MIQNAKQCLQRLSASLLAVFVLAGALLSNSMPVHAADGTINYHAGANIPYGSYSTSRMTFDGSNTAYCVEPKESTPPSGTYSYNLLGSSSPIRKALYYLNGGYGYDKHIKKQYLSGWSDDNSYVIGHLVVAYIYADYSSSTGAFYGAPQNYIDKAVEVANAIKDLPAPPETFRAFIVPGRGSQTIVGSWYQVPYGYIELRKSSANGAVSDGNGNYSLKGAEYGIFKGEKQVAKLTTDENGYAKSGELEAGSYTVKELTASKGYIVDVTAHNVTVEPEKTAAVTVREVPQSNPMDLLLQKLDKERKKAEPQGSASLAEAQFTVKFYTGQSDTDPAAGGAKPARTWIFKTDAEGKVHFSKNYLVSGDAFYAEALKGHNVVVFEKLYVTVKEEDKEKEVELTNHEDIQAESQTVKLTEIPTESQKPADTPDAPKTGDTTNLWIPIAVLVVALAGIVAVIIRIRRKKF